MHQARIEHLIAVCNFKYAILKRSRVMRTCFLHMLKNKGADQLHGNHASDQHLCFCYIVQAPCFLNPKFQSTRCLLLLYSPVFVRPWKQGHVFSCHRSNKVVLFLLSAMADVYSKTMATLRLSLNSKENRTRKYIRTKVPEDQWSCRRSPDTCSWYILARHEKTCFLHMRKQSRRSAAQ